MDKNKIKINKEGRETLTNLLLSCVLMPTKLVGKLAVVKKMSMISDDLVELDMLQTGASTLDYLPILDTLQERALSKHQEVIDSEFLWRYFGGQDHFVDVIRDVTPLPVAQRQLWTIAHMLLPVVVQKKTEEFARVVYENGGSRVQLQNVYWPSHLIGGIGDTVLIHYATVVDVGCSSKLVRDLLSSQQWMPELVESLQVVSQINFKSFFTGDLASQTKAIFVKG